MKYRNLSILTLGVIALLTILSGFYATRLRFDYNFDNFFPKGDPDLVYFQQFREQFGNDNDYLLVGLDHGRSIFDPAFLPKVDSLTRYLASLPQVRKVLSPTNVTSTVIEPFGVFDIPYLHPHEPGKYAQDSALIYQTPELVGTLFSTDGRSVSLSLQTVPELSKQESEELKQVIAAKTRALGLEKFHLAGKVLLQNEIINRMGSEVAVFMSASIVLVALVLFYTFRSIWLVWVPLVVVLLAVVWCLGLMGFLEKPIDILTVMMPTILFVVGMSDVVHILTRYLAEISHGQNKVDAVRATFREVGLATFLTTLTTALGFLTMVNTNVVPVQNFALFTALSVFIAFALAFLMLPAILILMKKPPARNAAANNEGWQTGMRRLFGLVLRHQKAILGVSAVTVLVSLIGVSQIRVDARMLEDLADSDPLVRDFAFFEENFSGVRQFELHLTPAAGHTVYSLPVLQEINQIEQYLLQTYGLHFIASPATLVKAMNRSLNGGSQAYYRLPATEAELARVTKRLKGLRKNEALAAVVAEDLRQGRLTGKMADVGSSAAKVLNTDLQTFMGREIDPAVLKTRLTGSALLLDKNNDFLTRNMLQGLLIAFIAVAVIVGIIYRSFAMVLISLVPNVIPLLMIGALLGFTGVTMKISTSLIFTIAFGIAVDDTIHFISKLKLELMAGKPMLYALKRTMISTGKAIILTTCILMAGFMTMILSTFNSTFYIGLLISLTLLLAVIADLLLLPVLILRFYCPRKKAVSTDPVVPELVS
jgi:predicted RND superfamily exporter protein